MPDLAIRNLQQSFDAFPWRHDDNALRAWQRGQTGYPIVDAAPFFRVFNPVLEGEKFDPDGAYVRRWVPEIAQLPTSVIHRPWSATPFELKGAGVELGKSYPKPIIDHMKGRERALAAYATVRAA